MVSPRWSLRNRKWRPTSHRSERTRVYVCLSFQCRAIPCGGAVRVSRSPYSRSRKTWCTPPLSSLGRTRSSPAGSFLLHRCRASSSPSAIAAAPPQLPSSSPQQHSRTRPHSISAASSHFSFPLSHSNDAGARPSLTAPQQTRRPPSRHGPDPGGSFAQRRRRPAGGGGRSALAPASASPSLHRIVFSESLVEGSSIPLKNMKPASSHVSERAGSDKHHPRNRVFPERSLSMNARFDAHTVGFFSPSTRVDFGRSSSLSRAHDVGSWRRRSLSLSRDGSSQTFGDIPSDVIAQIGDSGDRVVDDQEENGVTSECSGRVFWGKGSVRLSRELEYGISEGAENSFIAQVGDSGNRVVSEDAYGRNHSMRVEQGSVTMTENSAFSVEDDTMYNGFPPGDMILNEFSSTMSSMTGEMTSPLPTGAILYSREKKVSTYAVQSMQSSAFKQYKLPRSLDYMAHLIHLAVFGIFGVFARHLLQKLFGPGCLALTSDETPLYLDLPANMAGSFLMGWFGLVFKGDVRHVSEHLAVGLTTGFMGSLTTFSGWNQKMLDLSSKDHWVFAVAGIILGFFIVNESFRYGVASAEWFRKCLSDKSSQSPESATFIPERWRVQRPSQHFTVMIMMLLLLGLLWSISGVLARTRLDSVTDGAVLWLACIVGPPGVWLRWYLARFNGQGLGKKGSLKWLPLGTLAANLLAALIMAALATISKAVNTKRCGIITRGVQFGFLGCLSTVSTFAAEVYGLRQSGREGRAFTYAAATFILSFAGGTLVYSIPVWTKHYH